MNHIYLEQTNVNLFP